MPKIATNLYIS